MKIRSGGGGAPPNKLMRVFGRGFAGGWFYDNRSASRVIYHRQRIDEKSKPRDRSESRVIKIDDKTTWMRDRSTSRVMTNHKGGGLKIKKTGFVHEIHEYKHRSRSVTAGRAWDVTDYLAILGTHEDRGLPHKQPTSIGFRPPTTSTHSSGTLRNVRELSRSRISVSHINIRWTTKMFGAAIS